MCLTTRSDALSNRQVKQVPIVSPRSRSSKVNDPKSQKDSIKYSRLKISKHSILRNVLANVNESPDLQGSKVS